MISAPEWLPDPTGRHALRYWDGGRWLDAVTDGSGTQAEDALPAQPMPAIAFPGWYSDTGGRHQLRYWSGVCWADAVSDDGTVGSDPAEAEAVPPRATPAGWYPDPAGSARVRFWNGEYWNPSVTDRKGNYHASDFDITTATPPTSDRSAAPPARGMRAARKAGWHIGVKAVLKAAGHDRCPQCGGELHAIEVSRPGQQIEYTPETTEEVCQPCAACGFVPPWSRRAGLYPDPSGVHEYRYWAGDRWTDAVADAGVGASDPLEDTALLPEGTRGTAPPLPPPPPHTTSESEGWKPDPTARFPDRYWDGREWTKWVRDKPGGTRSEDPIGELAPPGPS